jgi:hypothetical protein
MRTFVSPPGVLNVPQAIRVQVDDRGRPLVIDGVRVETVKRDWLNGFAWWRDKPVRRRYYEVTTVTGGRVVVFRDVLADRWFSQQA